MLPSPLTRDIQQGLQQFLITGFEPSNDFMHGLMRRFVDDQSRWLKGSYLQVGLPFTPSKAGRKFLNGFETMSQVILNPERDCVIKAHTGYDDIQRLDTGMRRQVA